MKNNTPITALKAVIASTLLVSLAACDNYALHEYSINITNLTNAQPLSPPVAMLHKAKFNFWKVGDVASQALEKLSEGGDGSGLLVLKKITRNLWPLVLCYRAPVLILL